MAENEEALTKVKRSHVKYYNVKVGFIVVCKPNVKLTDNISKAITEELNIALSKIERLEGVRLITAFYINSEDW